MNFNYIWYLRHDVRVYHDFFVNISSLPCKYSTSCKSTGHQFNSWQHIYWSPLPHPGPLSPSYTWRSRGGVRGLGHWKRGLSLDSSRSFASVSCEWGCNARQGSHRSYTVGDWIHAILWHHWSVLATCFGRIWQHNVFHWKQWPTHCRQTRILSSASSVRSTKCCPS